jgi:dethiobiotin synthase
MKGLFITGTDTGVGKTVVSAALMHRYRKTANLRYWKPIQTGIEQDDDTAEVERLGNCGEAEVRRDGIRLQRPVSPHLAARLAGYRIDLPALRNSIRDEPNTNWIVEGAGGVLVPVNEIHLMTDWMMILGLPVLIAARSGLGTINHTLLTIEALRTRLLKVMGVIMIGDVHSENRSAIERYGDVPVLAEMPRLNPLRSETLNQWSTAYLDRDGILEKCLQSREETKESNV